MTDRHLLEVDPAKEALIVAAARDGSAVQGLTHNHYRYPARFSGLFARSMIETFTDVGDVVLDPHVGGGTTVVEAAAAGRHAIGVDISALAEFVTSVKTMVYEDEELLALGSWAHGLEDALDPSSASVGHASEAEPASPYRKHLDHPDRRALELVIEHALAATAILDGRLQEFGRCVVLRTAQTALDGRRVPPPASAFRTMLGRNAVEMVASAKAYASTLKGHVTMPDVRVLQRSSDGLDLDPRVQRGGPPRLVLTSPPYPGIHVLYHRWQVGGGRETAAPFWIAARKDGAGASHYTMGDRRSPGLDTYFEHIRNGMRSVAALCDERTTIVQMLAFADASTHLPRYLKVMREIGLRETFLPSMAPVGDGRLWRDVPNRKWYSDQRGATPASKEVVLFHTLAPATRIPCAERASASGGRIASHVAAMP